MIQSEELIPGFCLYCDRPLLGRADKIYCNVNCKNNYHSRSRALLRSRWHEDIPLVLKAIKKNYHILVSYGVNSLEPDGVIEVEKENLLLQGFNPNVMTSTYHDGKSRWYCCFDCRWQESSPLEVYLAPHNIELTLSGISYF